MSISIEELNRMNPDSYQIIDIRDETEIGHGAIPGAVAVATEEIEGNEKIDFSKKLVICCSRGKYSVDVAEELSEKGIDAESLEGGYIAWLIDNMKQKEAAEKALVIASSKLDSYVNKGIHHKNYAIRQKSKLAKLVNSI